MKKIILVLVGVLLLSGCGNYNVARSRAFIGPKLSTKAVKAVQVNPYDLINQSGSTIAQRIETPDGFERVAVLEDSFGYYLRNFQLKPHDAPVRYYDGDVKTADVHAAVLDIDVGDKDLQQCADAVMRLRAEYLYSKADYDSIHFNFTSGFRAEYSKWRSGYRIAVNGNAVSWVRKTSGTEDYQSFRKYLDMVFSYAGTLSLSKELDKAELEDMQIGDVFIKGGSPGHCVIVVDMAENKATGEKLFLLAQSYMPAQDIHVLKNPQNDGSNPWYSLTAGQSLDTPEWDFTTDQLMRFKND